MRFRKEKIDEIALIIICSTIIFSSFLIGTPLKDNFTLINAILNILALIYVIINTIIDPKKSLVDNSVCYAVLFLTISSIIPVLTNTYISLSDTLKSFLDYTAILSIFIVVNILENKNKVKYIINSIIASAVIICLIGLDDLTNKFLTHFLLQIGNVETLNPDGRMFSNFGYANAFAIFTSSAFFLLFKKYLYERSLRNSIIEESILLLFMMSIMLSFSRWTWLILAIILIIDFLIQKDKKIKINTIETLILLLVISLVYMKFYNGYIHEANYVMIWSIFVICLIINIILQEIKRRLEYKTPQISLKIIITIIFVIALLAILSICYLLKFTKPLKLFESIYSNSEYTQNINYISSEDNYKVEINLESKSNLDNGNAYEITINEKNRYNDTIKEHKIEINNYLGTKELTFEKEEDTKYLTITYKSLYKSVRNGLTINDVRVNGINVDTDYKYLPVKLVEKIKNSNMGMISISERIVFMQDGIHLIGKYGFLGTGGNSWEELQYQVQDYYYVAKEVHSYLIEVFLEFGFLGFISIIAIIINIIFILKRKYKNPTIETLCMTLLLILIHSFFDFGMSFSIIMIEVFVLLGLIEFKKKERKKFLVILLQIIMILIIMAGTCGNIMKLSSEVIFKENVQGKSNALEKCEKCLEIYPFNIEARKYMINNSNNDKLTTNLEYWLKYEKYKEKNYILEIISSNIKTQEDLIRFLEQVQKDENIRKKDIENEITRYDIIKKTKIKFKKEQNQEIEKILEIEKEKNLNIIEDKSTRITQKQKQEYLERMK